MKRNEMKLKLLQDGGMAYEVDRGAQSQRARGGVGGAGRRGADRWGARADRRGPGLALVRALHTDTAVMADKKVAEQYYAPPPELGKWEGFKLFLWNSETRQFLGRTGKSWAQIIFFYILFYSALAGFFATMLAVFYQTLDYQKPKWQMNSSLIGSNPGLGFRPMPPESTVDSTLIWYKARDEGNVNIWTGIIDDFLQVYKAPAVDTSGATVDRMHCDYTTNPRTTAQTGTKTDGSDEDMRVCDVPINSFEPCTSSNHFNYHKSAPCIFLKLNKIFGWQPEPYNETDKLPEHMPNDLKQHILTERYRNSATTNTIWVSCEGENPADTEHIGAIQYIPRRGFPGFYFPFKNQPGYLSPLVAVFFERPATGVLINIECKAWAKNIFPDRHERRGSVHFELMVD